jgi:hypothetical protein
VDLEYFEVYGNSLTGSIPAALSAWQKVKHFDVGGNEFTGILPSLDFGGMTEACFLLLPSPTNSFSCPWPPGAMEWCTKNNRSPITNADCHGTPPPSYKCTAGQCVVAATGASKADCEALCTPQLFACTNNTCVQASAGVPHATCEGACGPAQGAAPLLLE